MFEIGRTYNRETIHREWDGERLFRVDVMNLHPDREQETHRLMQLEILGLKG